MMEKNKPRIVICVGSSCFARGNSRNVEVAEAFLQERHLEDAVDVELAGALCLGRCADGPNVIIDGRQYNHVDASVMRDLLEELFPAGDRPPEGAGS